MRLSYSKLRTFGDCALQYRYAYVEKVKRPPVRGLAFERRIHRALQHFHQTAPKDGLVDAEVLLSAWWHIWEADEVPGYDSLPTFAEGERLLKRFAERESAKGRVTAEVERKIVHPFGPYTLVGSVDRLDFTDDGGYSVVDYKLDRRLPEGNSAEGNRQLAFYALLIEKGAGLPVRDARLYYLRHGVEHCREVTNRDLNDAVLWTEATAENIRREKHWQPSEGAHCKACSYQAECPLKSGKARPLVSVYRQGDLEGLF